MALTVKVNEPCTSRCFNYSISILEEALKNDIPFMVLQLYFPQPPEKILEKKYENN